jgi:2-polyprenyl-6-methoxyphenol hydroxylase-like FAD-dependent oxidoreductase
MRGLWAPLPEANLHINKKLIAIKTVGKSTTSSEADIELSFEDGTTDRFDRTIGADSVFSVMRKFVLRVYDWASVAPTPCRFWDTRVLIQYDGAKKVLGKAYFQDKSDC